MPTSKPARTFHDLLVWQRAHHFVLETYTVTAAFPKQETYGFSSQMRRAAVSIPVNIAEGFRNIAEGSVEECRYFLILVKDLGYNHHSELQP
jgi:four helix bundle protein